MARFRKILRGKGIRGIENLALIPGSVGAAPVQNIGAYGVEVKDVITQVRGIHLDGSKQVFSNSESEFGYRDSIFKRKLRDKYFITAVRFLLKKQAHQLNLGYASLKTKLDQEGIHSPDIKDVFNAVIAIRNSKLPNPEIIGNAGSFFKNPVIEEDAFNKLKFKYPEIPGYKQQDSKIKLFAAWLIETAGWKGTRRGDAGVHDKQALVLVNYGNAKGIDIWNLALDIKKDVKLKFGIELEPEVRAVNP